MSLICPFLALEGLDTRIKWQGKADRSQFDFGGLYQLKVALCTKRNHSTLVWAECQILNRGRITSEDFVIVNRQSVAKIYLLLIGSLEKKLLTFILEDRPRQYMEVSQVTGKETTQCWYISKYVLFPKVSDYKRFIFKTSEIQNSAFGFIREMSTHSLSPL